MIAEPEPEPEPVTGLELYIWLERTGRKALRTRARRLGRQRGYPSLMVRWSDDQVADVWHELIAKPARGESRWGGSGTV